MNQATRILLVLGLCLGPWVGLGCGNDNGGPPCADGGAADGPGAAGGDGSTDLNLAGSVLTLDELMDPTTCQACHPSQYADWAGSVHASAGDDPVFTALNKQGQREANLQDFCLRCHAPIARQLGLSTDGSNLASVAPKYKGVTCYFCHAVADVQGTHSNPIVLASDGVMRGQSSDSMFTPAHASGYSPWIDRDRYDSAQMCGSCHDIKTGAGVIERVFYEWTQSVFSQAPTGATCSQCHMNQTDSLVAGANVPGAPLRRLHSHGYPAVDVGTGAAPSPDTRKQQMQALLDSTLQSTLCVRGQGASATIMVVLDNVASGHAWPSGSAMVRRGWAEVTAYAAGNVIYQSGVVPDGTPIASLKDPDLWIMRDCDLDDQNHEVPPWAATQYESSVLPAQLTFDRNDPRFYQSHVYATYPGSPAPSPGVDGGTSGSALLDGGGRDASPVVAGLGGMPDKVQLRIRMEAMGLDFIDGLIASGDLDPSIRAKIPVYSVGGDPTLVWTAATANELFLDEQGQPVSCVSHTNLKAQADKVPARRIQHCQP